MIFLKWEEPVAPNGLITQYEVKTLFTQMNPSNHVLSLERLYQETFFLSVFYLDFKETKSFLKSKLIPTAYVLL